MCGIARHRPRRLRAAGGRGARCGAWRARMRHRGPDGFGLALEPGRRPGLHAPGDLRHRRAAGSRMRGPAGGALVYNGEVYNHPELRAELEPAASASPPRATPRSSCGCSSARGSPRWIASTASSRSPGGSRGARRLTLVRDRFGVRPLHYALRRRTAASRSPRRPRPSSRPARSTPRRTSPAIDEVFTLWGAARAAHRLRRRAASCRPGGLLVWEDGRVVERAPLVAARGRRRGTPRDGDLGELLRDSVRPAAARRRPGRRLPVGRPGLEPDHRAGARGQRRPAADLLGRLPRSRATTSARPGGGRAASWAPSTTSSRSGPTEIAAAFPEVVAHAETPLIRTAPVPLYLLAARHASAGHHGRR